MRVVYIYILLLYYILILATPISDHLMQFCTIIGKKERSSKNYQKYIEVENLSPLAMNNFKEAIVKSNVYQTEN